MLTAPPLRLGLNVLLLLIDDLRAPFSPDQHLPNIRRLAQDGISFENAFAQQALCAPSRNSLLTGRRPDTLHLYDFYNYWRDFSGNFTTIPQFFKENGYSTYSFGKIFHPGASSNFTDDYPYSWSEFPYHPSTEIYKESKVCMDDNTGELSRNLVCPVVTEFQPEKTLPDIQIAQSAIKKLKDLNETCKQCPFLMALGFHKPHIPLKFPKEYLDYYPLSKISLPTMPFRPPSMPNVAWNPWTDVRDRDDIKKLNISFPFGQMPDEWSLKIKQSYFAASTYIDSLIGDVIKHVNMDNTIVVLTSDHGWSLGEHGEWAKYSNFDTALRVPLIFLYPKQKNNFKRFINTKAIVELVDLFPTLAELSGIVPKFPECRENYSNTCTEGHSLAPLIKSLMHETDNVKWTYDAFSQYPRPGIFPSLKPNSDKPKLKQITIMGYSVCTERFRYTEWVEFNHTSFKPNWEKIIAKEFYDHLIDSGENLNLQNRRELHHIQRLLSDKLKNNF